MSRKTNYFNIGMFVIVAVVLITAGVVVFGTGAVGRNNVLYEAYFDESIQGLSIGSPLKYRGVDIGRVERIDLASQVYHGQLEGADFVKYGKYVRVVMAVETDKIAMSPIPGNSSSEGDQLRVRITAQGITGLSFLDMDFLDPVNHPTLEYTWEPQNPCLPSAKGSINKFMSDIETALHNISDIDFIGIQNKLNETLEYMSSTFKSFQETVDSLNVERLSADFSDLISLASQAIDSINLTVANIDGKVSEIQMKEINDKLVMSLDEFKQTCEKISTLLENDSDEIATIPELTREMEVALKTFSDGITEAGRDINQITEDVSRFADNMDNLVEDVNARPAKLFFSSDPAESKVLE